MWNYSWAMDWETMQCFKNCDQDKLSTNGEWSALKSRSTEKTHICIIWLLEEGEKNKGRREGRGIFSFFRESHIKCVFILTEMASWSISCWAKPLKYFSVFLAQFMRGLKVSIISNDFSYFRILKVGMHNSKSINWVKITWLKLLVLPILINWASIPPSLFSLQKTLLEEDFEPSKPYCTKIDMV